MAENTARTASDLCQSCGLCCTGLLFPFVLIEKADEFVLGQPDLALSIKGPDRKTMTLGCSFLDGTRCSIYENRPQKCQTYSCKLRRSVLNGSEDGGDALSIITNLKALVEAIDPMLVKLSGTSFHEMNFRNFCHKFAEDATARIKNGSGLSATEQQFVVQAFEILKIIDRYIVDTNRLAKFATLMVMENQWGGTPNK